MSPQKDLLALPFIGTIELGIRTYYNAQTFRKLELTGAVVMGSLPGRLGTPRVWYLVPEHMCAESTLR